MEREGNGTEREGGNYGKFLDPPLHKGNSMQLKACCSVCHAI